MSIEGAASASGALPAPIVRDSGAPFYLPPDRVGWEVAEGSAEVYLMTPDGRNFLTVASPGDAIFPATLDDEGIHLHIIASSSLTLSPMASDHARLPGAYSQWVAATDTKTAFRDAPSDDAVVTPDHLFERAALHLRHLARRFAAERQADDHEVLSRLGDNTGPATAPKSEIGAIAEIAEAFGIDAANLPRSFVGTIQSIPALCRLSGLRARKIMLEEGWQTRDQGPLVVFKQASGVSSEPTALFWDGRGYRPKDGARLTALQAADFVHVAFSVSAPLPVGVQGFWSLAGHILRQGNTRDILTVALAAAIVAGLGVLTPLATAWLLSDIVPAGIPGLLLGVGVALACAAIISTALKTAGAMATHRIDGRGATALNSALTDRLLRLPVGFFKDFAPGDLNQRLQNVEDMRQLVVSVVLNTGLTAVLSVVYLAVLLTYDTRLALIGIALVAVYILAVVLARVLQMEAIREAATLDGDIAALTYETLDGVAKLRASAAEERAMTRWLDVYRREQAARVRAGRVGVRFRAFADAYQTMTMMFLFAGAITLTAADVPAGVFIGFLAAFGAFQGAFVGLSEALLEIYTAQPLADRAKPVLEAKTETSVGSEDPGNLTGHIEASGLTFSYDTSAPPVLNKLDFTLDSGQHMAIVGASGSGKSTLLRLLLGFEAPQTGAILYDGQDLSKLDVTRVRGQIGVVLQASELFAGSILDNIRGASDASLEDCLHAAERAGLSRDLEYFAMGVHTPLTEGAGTLSGGQRQRILIARALAAKPKILFFDEATSALDNATQAIVSDTLDVLNVTRVTIAHRLSTVRHADIICVLKDGRFAEQGTFAELMSEDGLFAELARRQLIEE